MLHMALDLTPRKQPKTANPAGRQTVRKVRCLIAHENRTIRRFLRGCLEGIPGFEVAEWIPGDAILGTLLAERASLLIVNGETPEMEEWKLVKRIRALPGAHQVKIMVVSGESSQEVIEKAIVAGVDDYLVLPFSATFLEKRIEGLLAERPEKETRAPREQLTERRPA